MTVEIVFSDLSIAGPNFRQSISVEELLENQPSHIHGRLTIVIGGRELPYLGYWGPDDVCFNTWTEELVAAVNTLSRSESAEYTFDEGEQSQPAFRFVRRGDLVLVSIVDSEISEGAADPDWQDVPCRFDDLRNEVERLLREFYGVAPLRASKRGKRRNEIPQLENPVI